MAHITLCQTNKIKKKCVKVIKLSAKAVLRGGSIYCAPDPVYTSGAGYIQWHSGVQSVTEEGPTVLGIYYIICRDMGPIPLGIDYFVLRNEALKGIGSDQKLRLV